MRWPSMGFGENELDVIFIHMPVSERIFYLRATLLFSILPEYHRRIFSEQKLTTPHRTVRWGVPPNCSVVPSQFCSDHRNGEFTMIIKNIRKQLGLAQLNKASFNH